MASAWFIARDGQQFGPMSSRQVKELVQMGKLGPTVLIWKEGMASWVPAGSIPDLYPPVGASPPPLPPASVSPPPLPPPLPPPMPSPLTPQQSVPAPPILRISLRGLARAGSAIILVLIFAVGIVWKFGSSSSRNETQTGKKDYTQVGSPPDNKGKPSPEKEAAKPSPRKDAPATQDAMPTGKSGDSQSKPVEKLPSQKDKVAAFLVVVEGWDHYIDVVGDDDKRTKWFAIMKRVQKEFSEIPFDPTKNKEEARKMFQIYRQRLASCEKLMDSYYMLGMGPEELSLWKEFGQELRPIFRAGVQ